MKPIIFIVLLSSLYSSYLFAGGWDQVNVVEWSADAIPVSKYSVVPVPEKCSDRAKIELGQNIQSKVIKVDDNTTTLTAHFSVNKSPDGKYWVIDSTLSCSATGNSCITMELLKYDPQTTAVVSCMKYKGLTVRMGQNGEPIIESDIPAYQEALKRSPNKSN